MFAKKLYRKFYETKEIPKEFEKDYFSQYNLLTSTSLFKVQIFFILFFLTKMILNFPENFNSKKMIYFIVMIVVNSIIAILSKLKK